MANGFLHVLCRVLAMVSRETPCELRTGATECARRGAAAFGKHRVVESAYWVVMADLGGMRNLGAVLADYVAAWVAKGTPERDETTELTEYQQAFAQATLRWFADQDKAKARAWFEKAAEEGNADAVAFLRKHG